MADAKTILENAKKKTEFDLLMKLGSAAMSGKRFAEAKNLFADALKLAPNDPAALRSLQDANQALTPPPPPKDSKTPVPPKPDPKKADPPEPTTGSFQGELAAAAKFEQQGKFAEANDSYKLAVKLAPDPKAAAQAQKKADFSLRMSEGLKHFQGMRWQDAEREFAAALQHFPGHPIASQLLQRAKQKKN